LNFARRQQYRRLSHAGKAALGSAVAALLGLVIANAGAPALAGLLLLTAVGLGLYARHWLSLARRSRVGARSEDEVQRALASLQAEGWRLRHSLPRQGRGDIDSVAIAPTGVAVAIETKTRTYDARHLARVHEQAAWLSRRRRTWCRHGTLAVLCLVQARGVQRVEDDVLVVSIDRLMPAVRSRCVLAPVPSDLLVARSEHLGRRRSDRRIARCESLRGPGLAHLATTASTATWTATVS
jgi:Holliday junction resolvase-like predicted endonuclease